MPTARNLWIREGELAEMRDLASQFAPLETGGVLVGYDTDCEGAVVTAVIGAGPKASHRRLRFRPDYDYQQAQLEAHFVRTLGRETYLGDWHTHPAGGCALSWLDRRVLVRIASMPSSGTTRPIMMILAGGQPDWNLHASQLRALPKGLCKKTDLRELIPVTYDN